MSVTFPLSAFLRSTENDIPKPAVPVMQVCLGDARGYYARLGGYSLTLPGDAIALGDRIADMLNAAYEQGRADQAAAVREVLDYGRGE